MESLRKDAPISPTVLAKLMEHRIGQAILESEGHMASWGQFCANITKRLADLVQLIWDTVEVANFSKAAKVDVKMLLNAGFAAFDKYTVDHMFWGRRFELKINSLKEVAPVKYQLALRQIYVNTGGGIVDSKAEFQQRLENKGLPNIM